MKYLYLVATVLLILPTPCAIAAPEYRIENLGIAGRDVTAIQINNNGAIVLTVAPEEPIAAPPLLGESLLIQNGVSTPLGSLGGLLVSATGLNDTGSIVGWADVGGLTTHAILFEGQHLIDLGINGTKGSIATAINNKGDIVGFQSFDTVTRAFHRSSSGVVNDLESLGGNWSRASDINNSGEIVGASRNLAGNFEAFFIGSKGVEALGTLGGIESYASAINDQSMIVGAASPPSNIQHAALFVPGDSPIDLASSWAQSGAADINNLGQIVGFVTDSPDQELQAALFSIDAPPVLLKNLIPANSRWTSLYSASGINDRGQIVGTGIFNGQPGLRAFLMTPIPEPASLLLIMAAAILLAESRCKRRPRRRIAN